METIIKGGTLMVFYSYDAGTSMPTPKSIPLATNHTLRISAETSELSHKDIADAWAANDVTQFSWEATTDNLYCDNGVEVLFGFMKNKTKVLVYFSPKTQAEGTALPNNGSWSCNTSSGFCGWAYITSLDINAQNGENATYSATFTGCDKLQKNWT